MIFSYTKFPLDRPNPLTRERYLCRPVVIIDLGHEGHFLQTTALLDTGADWNFAPLEYASALDIDVAGCPTVPVGGIGQGTAEAAFAPVRIRIGGKKIDTMMGFGNFPIILLGQCGFFDRIKSASFHFPLKFELIFR